MGNVVGVDEVGRGCLAGPLLVVAARQTGVMPNGVRDSKLMTREQREAIFEILTSNFKFGEGWVQPEEIDERGLTGAMRLGVYRALLNVRAGFEEKIIMDGNVNYCPTEYNGVEIVIKADLTYPIVSAASVYAKVTRDEHMRRIAKFHPFYGFERHVGYATKLHLNALKAHGASRIHRRSFRPVQEIIAGAVS